MQIKITRSKRLSQPRSRHEICQIERVSICRIRCVERQVFEKRVRDREVVWLLPERDRVRVHVARRRLGGEIGCERFGVSDEWMRSPSMAHYGVVDGG